MKRSHYTAYDFLADREFVNWVKQPTPEKDRYWQLWMETHPDCKDVMLEAREMILSMKFQLPRASQQEKLAILKRILKAGDKTKNLKRASMASRMRLIAKIAATVTLLLSSVYLLVINSEYARETREAESVWTVKEVAKGKRIQIKLPDGTRVWINAESKLSYDTSFNHTQRQVLLIGEAFFEVARDTVRPFTVKSGSLITKAIGTSFNIKAFTDEPDIEVSLVTGKAGVIEIGAGSQTMLLEPGERVISSKAMSGLKKQSFNIEEGIGWKDGLLYFKNDDFDEIKKRLERWYGVSIHVDPSDRHYFEQWSYTGKFENLSLELVLKRIGFTKDFTFNIENQEIYLYPKF